MQLDKCYRKKVKVPYDKITISEIAGYANSSRSTLYQYFKSKKDIVVFFIRYLLDSYLHTVDKSSIADFKSLLVVYFEFWNTNKKYLRILKKHSLLDFALNVERRFFLERLPSMKLSCHKNGAKAELFADLMVIGGVWNVAACWTEKNNNFDSTYIANGIVESLFLYKEYV